MGTLDANVRRPAKIVLVRLGAWAVLVFGLACQRRPTSGQLWTPESIADFGPVVAQVGEVPIFAAEVKAQARQSGKAPRAALEDLVAFHLLAERTRARSQQPAMEQRVRKEVLVQRLLEREFEPTTGIDHVPDAELRALYEQNRDGFVHPRLIEVTVLTVPVRKTTTGAEREQARAMAQTMLVAIRKKSSPQAEVLRDVLAETNGASKGATLYHFFQRIGEGIPYSEKFSHEVVKLKAPGDTTGVIEDGRGFHIARFISDKPPKNQSYEELREKIRESYYPLWRQRRFVEFAERIAEKHSRTLHVERLMAPGRQPGS